MSFRFNKFSIKWLASLIAITLSAVFITLNWFARQPQEQQQCLYKWLRYYPSYKLYYFSNIAASMTDSLGITGHDSVAAFTAAIPEVDLVVGGHPLSINDKALPAKLQHFKRTGFTVCYAPELRHPVWVASKVHDGKRFPKTNRPSFKKDPAALNSPTPNSYTKTGYDRGHMAPNQAIATCYGKEAQKETFLLSNICPQRPGLNRGPWRKIEHRITDIWPSRYGNIWVITGAYSPDKEKKLPSGINIPVGFYKIIVSKKRDLLRVLALYMDQSNGYGVFPRTRIISVDELEELTGLDFLSELPDKIENKLEADKPTRLWPADFKGNIRLLIAHFKPYY
ncbi:MAG: DNA/RNA non-specific endonuclease [Kiritimatiellae bacterium]|jgi:endonuclease G|nr:DNA/RNA non-specific endonuclease [Kiritimatiellia bacterium]